MKKTILILSIPFLLGSCGESSQRDATIETDMTVAAPSLKNQLLEVSEISELNSLMQSDIQKFEIQIDGELSYDSGTAATGRFAGNIRDLDFSLRMTGDKSEEEDAGSPSAGIEAVIDVKCKSGKDCLEDSSTGIASSSSVMSFTTAEEAEKVLKLLKEIQRQAG